MSLIGTLVSFSPGQTISSSDTNSNNTAIRNAFNSSAVMNDLATTITVTHIFSVSQDFQAGIITSGTSTFGSSAVFSAGITVVSGQTITASGVTVAGGFTISGIATFTTTPRIDNGSRAALALYVASVRKASLDSVSADTIRFVDSTDAIVGFQFVAHAAARIVPGATSLLLRNNADDASNLALTDAGLATFRNTVTVTPTANNTVAYAVTGVSVTGSGATALCSFTGTWNTSGSPDAVSLDVTNTAAGASATLVNLKVAGTSKFSVNVSGNVTCSGILTIGGTFSPSTVTPTVTSLGAPGISFSGIADTGLHAAVAVTGNAVFMVANGTSLLEGNDQDNTRNGLLSNVRFKIAVSKNMVVGATIVTSATLGFLYIPTMAGTATGVPTTETGSVALCFDTTNSRLQIYNAGWKTVAVT
jgi:hypothetical protein